MAPFPPRPPHSEQKENETIHAFFAQRREGNMKKMAKETPTDRQRRTQRAENAAKGNVPKKACVFVWEKQDGHYIRQPATRGNFADLWHEFSGPQRRYDPIHNQWDLCELFEKNDPLFGQGYDHPNDDTDDEMDFEHPTFPQNIDMASRLPREGTNIEVVQEQQPREDTNMEVAQEQRPHDLEMLSIEDVPDVEDLGPDFARTINDIDRMLLDCHQPRRFDRKLSPFEIGREYLKSMRNPSQQAYYYVLRRKGSGIGSEVLLIPRATDLVEVLRQQWGPDIRDVVAHLLARGIRFWLAHISAEIMPQSETPTPSGLGFRPHEYKFDEHDYHAYTTQRDLQLLHTPRGRIALQYGGVMARLARSEVSDDDFFRGFSEDMYDVGDCLWDGTSQHAYWHDALSDREIDLLCGVYHIGTGM
ncbi:hypothetical protein B0H11DRAFT_1720097 [Mycena galericulata]|nr:hypothetical protein B0H11DRAFT_1720097 [Mycena galericulata]